jgi:hypothetical protein
MLLKFATVNPYLSRSMFGVGTWIRHSLPLKRFKQQNTQEVTKVIVQGFR